MLTIRPRTPADLPVLVAALRAVHEAQGYPSLWPEDPEAFVTGRGDAWVTLWRGQPAGQVLLSPLTPPLPAWASVLPGPGPHLEVKRLFVAPAAQGQGAARALLAHAAAQARQAGARAALQVNERSAPATTLYEREGWRRLGRTQGTWREADGGVPTVLVYAAPA
ncbi:GNAT family N-acetyltransferase [Deinococcus arcticus]|uniref:GNAT family N-acetyltransferase n=1 Tax=Deinococcus arcticus TaxID=2136176 RepID=A0A2T3W901_9DEIO|nr:GNAT family N-acetyltransferase [Deinococcus arcticus]PTA68378.1 GNAT family N-acetyltransferase [Deinococcus arcticus]